jgi:glycosyltransferase involved in cell wall biosynthesis
MGISYVRGYRDPHRVLRPLSTAARSVPGLSVLRVPMHVPSALVGRLPRYVASPLFRLYAHWLLRARAKNALADWVLVREYLTLPLLLVSPMLFGLRHKMFFLCNHNINSASSKTHHRMALTLLHRMGFRFVLLEDAQAWRVVSSRPSSLEGVFVLPFPQPAIPARSEALDGSAVIVGLVGNFRAEKSPLWAVDALHEAIRVSKVLAGCSLLVGTSDAVVLKRCADVAETVDTSQYADYLATLRRCDIVVLPYQEQAYAYRTSGVSAEAVASGCAVVVPNLPVLREQVIYPIPVGTCYTGRGDLVRAVREAIQLRRSGKFDAAAMAHAAARGLDGVAQALKVMVRDAA